MALTTFSCNFLTPLHFKGLTLARSVTHWCSWYQLKTKNAFHLEV